jgi:pyruvate dehydrogenase E2 component (dihydrolipoamide acetyltransferase)
VVAVVETHKGAIDVECFLDGIIDDLAPVDQVLPVGSVLAHVHDVGETEATPALPSEPSARQRLSPAARRRATELGVEPGPLQGSGGGGVVVLRDVERAASAGAAQTVATPIARRVVKPVFDPAQMRQAIAAAMSRSKREIPHYYLSSTLDFSAAQTWLEGWNTSHEPAERLLPAVLLLKATARALVDVPQFNGLYENGAYRASSAIHAGWAVALRGGGLVAPAIHDVDHKSLAEVMTALRDLVQRARTGALRSSELTDPTITITSLGDRGAESVLGVIYPPQVAIVGFGQITLRPWVVAGQVVARPLVSVSLAADHRVSDGHLGGQLLAAIGAVLQFPENL